MRSIPAKLISVLCIGGLALAASPLTAFSQAKTDQVADLNSLRDSHNKTIARIEKDYADALKMEPTAYLKDLQKLQEAKQKAGDLDAYTAVGREIERSKAEQNIPDETDPLTLDSIGQLQAAHREVLAKFALERDKKIVAATTQYIDALTARQKKLTIAGKIDDALAFNAEIKNVQASAKFTAAQFAVDAEETGEKDSDEKRKSQADETAAPSPAETQKAAEKDKTPSQTETAKPAKTDFEKKDAGEIKIYEGQPFPATRGRAYKNVSMMATEHISGTPKIGVTATLSSDTDIEKKSAAWYSSTETWRHGTTSHSLRFTMKAVNKSFVVDDPKVVVEFYEKKATDQGKVSPSTFLTKTFSTPRIDGKRAINIECPTVSTESSSYKRVGRRWSEHTETGNELYGFIISVFDSDGALVFQTASNKTLKKFGTTQIPE